MHSSASRALLHLCLFRWCLQRREANQPETDCRRGSGEVQGEVSPANVSSFEPPLFTRAAFNGTQAWHESLSTHRHAHARTRAHTQYGARHGSVKDVQDTHWFHHNGFFKACWGK